ncbi:hypothetical protein NC651_012160 [Populus alba x Populus x berolinensis]|nr:hypothetical protein NC651_012160 [Populus alba x Populus x berolinensis]
MRNSCVILISWLMQPYVYRLVHYCGGANI